MTLTNLDNYRKIFPNYTEVLNERVDAWVYILHFDKPLGAATRQHYAGYTRVGIEKRMKLHRMGKSGYVRRNILQGNDFQVVYTEKYDTVIEATQRERALKKEGKLKKYCSICRDNEKTY